MLYDGQSTVLQIIETFRVSRRFTSHLNGRQQQRNKNANDGDDNQQLDKRKSSITTSRHDIPPRSEQKT